MARVIRLALIWILVLAVAAGAYLFGRDYVRRHPQDVPWTALRLHDPMGAFTLRKLAALTDDAGKCRTILKQGSALHVAVPPRTGGPDCGYADGMRIVPSEGEALFAPPPLVTSCPMAAALTIFERQVLQPAAARHFGSRVAVVEHAGSYSCRRINGRAEGAYSEHATADAVDVVGFRLADGTRISVFEDWKTAGPKSRFLHQVRDRSCRLFATVLSPDYNAAHADHLHLDHAERGKFGIGLCR